MLSKCLSCGAPLTGRRVVSTTCGSTCRSRIYRARQQRIIRLVTEQARAIARADYDRLEALILEAKDLGSPIK